MRTFVTAILLVGLGACGSNAPSGPAGGGGDGGTGGGAGTGGVATGGQGGGGGTGGIPRMPTILSLEPSHGPPGTEVIFHGRDLDVASGSGFAGAPSDILDIDPPGTFLRTIVPEQAVSGAVYVDAGDLHAEGPSFTVEVRKQVPLITSLDPAVFLVGQAPPPLTVYGVALSGGTLFIDGNEQPTSPVSGGLSAPVPAELVTAPGTHTVTVTTPAPAGGTSAAATFEVDAALRLVGAGFSGPGTLALRFDRPLVPGSAATRVVSIDPPLDLADAPATSPRMLSLTVKGSVPDATFTLSVSGDLRGADGSRLVPDAVSFRGWTALPELIDTRVLPPDCTARGLLDPTGLTASSTHLYVTERLGNQVQVFTLEGVPTVFFGATNDEFPVPTSEGIPAGCPGQEPASVSGLLLPVGAAVEQPGGDLLVADSGHGRLLRYGGMGGVTVISSDAGVDHHPLKRPAVLLTNDSDAYFAAADGLFRAALAVSGPSSASLLATTGTGDLQFGFDVAGGSTPAASWGPDPHAASPVAYVAEPGNHRLQRLDLGNSVRATGWVGVGHENGFATGAGPAPGCCVPGTGAGQFTRPNGVAVLPGGAILVIDEANGGRLQKLAPSGAPLASEDLGYMPLGIAAAPNGTLFIVEAGALHRYVP